MVTHFTKEINIISFVIFKSQCVPLLHTSSPGYFLNIQQPLSLKNIKFMETQQECSKNDNNFREASIIYHENL